MDQKELSDLIVALYLNCPIVKERLSFNFLEKSMCKKSLKKKNAAFQDFFQENICSKSWRQ